MRAMVINAVVLLFLVGCSINPVTKVTRYTMNPWEKEIGYVEVVQAGNTYYLSGVVCDGADYAAAVAGCYQELQIILARLKLTTNNIVKENVYARDIEKFKEQIELRKRFYGNDNYPAATWIQVDRFFMPSYLVEIEMVLVQ